MGVSKNNGTPKSSIINHPFWGIPIFGNTHKSARTATRFLKLWLLALGAFLVSKAVLDENPIRGPLYVTRQYKTEALKSERDLLIKTILGW